MTYCLGILSRQGLILAADSRTNAGVDYISSYQKLFDFSIPRERIILLCTSGSLSTSQAVLHVLEREVKTEQNPNIHVLPTLHDVARHIGKTMRSHIEKERSWLERDGVNYESNFLVGGQIAQEPPELYMVYGQGNFISATPQTPFLQIGETKYGKPILDRTLSYESSLHQMAKSALLSIDSTMRSNISVGPPINLVLYETNALEIRHRVQLQATDPYLRAIRKFWEKSLREASKNLPEIEWNKISIATEPDFDF